MDQEQKKNLTTESKQEQFFNYIDEYYQPLPCLHPKHKQLFSDICIDQNCDASNEYFYPICRQCIKENVHQNAKDNHLIVDIVSTLKDITKQIFDLQLPQEEQQQPNSAQEYIKHKAKLKETINYFCKLIDYLNKQLNLVQNQLEGVEKSQQEKQNTILKQQTELKLLIIQIVKQENSKFFTDYLIKLKDCIQIVNQNQIKVQFKQKDLQKQENITPQQQFSVQELEEINKKIVYLTQQVPELDKISQQQEEEVVAGFSYFLNEYNFEADSKFLLIEIDKFNSSAFLMPQALNNSLYKKHQITEMKQCINLWNKLSEQKNEFTPKAIIIAAILLGYCYLQGIEVEQNHQAAFKLFSDADKIAQGEGYAVAQAFIGNCYFKGRGVEKNGEKALLYYERSAALGFSLASYYLGCFYSTIEGAQQDKTKALNYFLKSADMGLSYSQNLVGEMYLSGIGISQDKQLAFQYLLKSANQGNLIGQNKLALCYLNGWGTEQSIASSLAYYQISAVRGNKNSQNFLGSAYFNGKLVETNYDLAFQYYKKSADQNDAIGQKGLGYCYYTGKGVTQNLIEAVNYLKLSSEQGNQDAQMLLKEVQDARESD